MKRRNLSLLALLCCTAFGSGQLNRPDYSGTWKLNTNKSTQDGPADRVYIKTVKQDKNSITVATKADGVTNLIDGTFPLSEKFKVEKQGNNDYRYTRAYWEGSTIKFELADRDSKKETAKYLFYIREGWTLSPDGKVLTTFRQTAEPAKPGEKPRLTDQKYVYDKQ